MIRAPASKKEDYAFLVIKPKQIDKYIHERTKDTILLAFTLDVTKPFLENFQNQIDKNLQLTEPRNIDKRKNDYFVSKIKIFKSNLQDKSVKKSALPEKSNHRKPKHSKVEKLVDNGVIDTLVFISKYLAKDGTKTREIFVKNIEKKTSQDMFEDLIHTQVIDRFRKTMFILCKGADLDKLMNKLGKQIKRSLESIQEGDAKAAIYKGEFRFEDTTVTLTVLQNCRSILPKSS